MPPSPAQSRYHKLVTDITALYQSAQKAVAQFYWQTGRQIVEVEQDGAVRGAYGAGLMQALSADLTRACGPGFSVNNLRRMRGFYLTYQKRPAPVELTWAHYVELMPVKDPGLRTRLERRAVKEHLASRDLRRLVHEAQPRSERPTEPAAKPPAPLKRPTGLKLNTYQEMTGPAATLLPTDSGSVVLDCGFFVCRAVTPAQAARVMVTDKPAYTYSAVVERVVDGDTLAVVIDLGFGMAVREKLRLRGIDTPELGTPAGEKAKRYVVAKLPAGAQLIIKTHKTDLYGRFVADVFYKQGTGTGEEIIKEGVYLNQELLDLGLAGRVG